jgi:putative DNA primase/helicase
VRGTVADKYPVLKGIARTPYLIGDKIHCERGYNPETGIWLETDMELPEIEVGLWQESLARLLDLVAEFPFEDDKDRSAWLADLLGGVARPTLPTMPGTIYTASTPGTGKTLLMELVNLIAYGESALGSWPTTEEERQKRLLASMRSSPYVAFDNVRNGARIRSEALTQLITSEYYEGRLLGQSEAVKIPNRTRVVLTGNNINAEGDMARRFVTIRLDAQMADPTQRRFRIYDIRQHVIDNRARLLADCLVLLLYGMQTPLADAPAPLASFTRWSRVVRETVISLGLPDPVLTVNIESEDLDLLDEAFEQIELAMAAYPKWKTHTLVEQCTLRPDLHVALLEAGCEDPKKALDLGLWLRGNRGRRAGGRILEAVGNESKTKASKMWKIRKL